MFANFSCVVLSHARDILDFAVFLFHYIIGLLLGTETPVITPNGMGFSVLFVFKSNCDTHMQEMQEPIWRELTCVART